MEAHEALRRHDHVHEAHEHSTTGGLAQQAALVVAVIAAFLAVATFMSNEAVKEVITGETKAADSTTRLEANSTKTTIADGDAAMLKALGADNPNRAEAIAKAEALDARITEELAPEDRRLTEEIEADKVDRAKAEDQHLFFELSEVALQIGIVLAGVAILARRRWLLHGSVLVAVAGVGLLAAGAIA